MNKSGKFFSIYLTYYFYLSIFIDICYRKVSIYLSIKLSEKAKEDMSDLSAAFYSLANLVTWAC